MGSTIFFLLLSFLLKKLRPAEAVSFLIKKKKNKTLLQRSCKSIMKNSYVCFPDSPNVNILYILSCLLDRFLSLLSIHTQSQVCI